MDSKGIKSNESGENGKQKYKFLNEYMKENTQNRDKNNAACCLIF